MAKPLRKKYGFAVYLILPALPWFIDDLVQDTIADEDELQ